MPHFLTNEDHDMGGAFQAWKDRITLLAETPVRNPLAWKDRVSELLLLIDSMDQEWALFADGGQVDSEASAFLWLPPSKRTMSELAREGRSILQANGEFLYAQAVKAGLLEAMGGYKSLTPHPNEATIRNYLPAGCLVEYPLHLV